MALSQALTRPAQRWPALLSLPFPVRTVVRRWRGMAGMLVGVSVALGLVLCLIGTIGTAMQTVLGDFLQSGANMYVAVNGGSLIPLERGSSQGTIDDGLSTLSKIRSIPGVQAAIGELSWSLKQEEEGRAARNQAAKFMQVVAIDGDPHDITNFLVMTQGRWLHRGNELVLGQTLAGYRNLSVGDSVKLNGQEFEVVGIGKLRGFGAIGDSVGYVDAANLRSRGITGDVFNFIAIQTTAPDALRSVADDLSLRATGATELAQNTENSSDYKGGMAFYWIIDMFILFVSGMFVSNTLSRSVAERRIEFGTLRAIGLPSRTIRTTVVVEGESILLISYLAGFVISLGLGWLINYFVARPLGMPDLFAVDPTGYSVIFLITMGLGAVAAYFPAHSATRVDPLEVLREA